MVRSLEGMQMAEQNPISVVPGATVVVVRQPECLISRYEPIAGRIFGGGTSSVLPRGAGLGELPEGAVLISCMETETTTSVR